VKIFRRGHHTGYRRPLVDFLLETEGFSGFRLQRIQGSPAQATLTLSEQVTGRKKQVMFQVQPGPPRRAAWSPSSARTFAGPACITGSPR
jgi:hypothetical protein